MKSQGGLHHLHGTRVVRRSHLSKLPDLVPNPHVTLRKTNIESEMGPSQLTVLFEVAPPQLSRLVSGVFRGVQSCKMPRLAAPTMPGRFGAGRAMPGCATRRLWGGFASDSRHVAYQTSAIERKTCRISTLEFASEIECSKACKGSSCRLRLFAQMSPQASTNASEPSCEPPEFPQELIGA